MTNADAFHAHLDRCVICRRHPFELCAEGARLLVEAVREERKEEGNVKERT